jgi:hypothetical protein
MVQQLYVNTSEIYICERRRCYFTLVGENNLISWGLNNWCSDCHTYTENNVRLTIRNENEKFYLWICPDCLVVN